MTTHEEIVRQAVESAMTGGGVPTSAEAAARRGRKGAATTEDPRDTPPRASKLFGHMGQGGFGGR